MLAEMGLRPQWRLRAGDGLRGQDLSPGLPLVDALAPPVVQPSEPESASEARIAPLERTPLPVAQAVSPHPAVQAEGLDWDGLAEAVAGCRACRLCERRKQAVLGVGDHRAEWMFVGEGPGAEEDERGEPFVGQAGRLLDAMLASVGMQRGQNVYIANAVKCRPPGNRTPERDEIEACRPYLERQIALVKPRLLIAMGRPAAQTLLRQDDLRISASRKRLFQHESGIPVVVTYHPAYLLRNLTDKAKAWEDLCFAQDEMAKLKD